MLSPEDHVRRVCVKLCDSSGCDGEEDGCNSSECQGGKFRWWNHDHFVGIFLRCPKRCKKPLAEPEADLVAQRMMGKWQRRWRTYCFFLVGHLVVVWGSVLFMVFGGAL